MRKGFKIIDAETNEVVEERRYYNKDESKLSFFYKDGVKFRFDWRNGKIIKVICYNQGEPVYSISNASHVNMPKYCINIICKLEEFDSYILDLDQTSLKHIADWHDLLSWLIDIFEMNYQVNPVHVISQYNISEYTISKIEKSDTVDYYLSNRILIKSVQPLKVIKYLSNNVREVYDYNINNLLVRKVIYDNSDNYTDKFEYEYYNNKISKIILPKKRNAYEFIYDDNGTLCRVDYGKKTVCEYDNYYKKHIHKYSYTGGYTHQYNYSYN